MTIASESPLRERYIAFDRLRIKRKKSVKFRQQTSNTDCGAACLAMVLEYYGKKLPLDEIRHVVGVDRDGSNAFNLLQAARWFGLRGRGVRIADVEELSLIEMPAIIHWEFRHFVVLEKITKDHVFLVDPVRGHIRIAIKEFSKSYTGIVLVFEKGEAFNPENKRERGIWRYINSMISERIILKKVIVLSLILQVFSLALPLITGIVVDRVIPKSDVDLLSIMGLGIAIFVVFRFVCAFLRSHLLLQLRTRLDSRWTVDFLEHLVDLPFSFFCQRSAGDLLTRIDSHITIREMLTTSTISAVLDGGLVLIYLVLLLVVNFQFGFLVSLLGMLQVFVFLYTRKKHRTLQSELLQVQAKSRGNQVELIAAIETLKSSGVEQKAVENWSNIFVDELNVELERGMLNTKVESILDGLKTASPLVLLLLGSSLVLNGVLSLGMMLAMSALAAGFLVPLSTLVEAAFELQRLGSYLERIDDVMLAEKEQDISKVRVVDTLKGGLTLKNVSFQYGPLAPPVVKNISLTVRPGEFVAIVGPSGSGKSTLAKLMLGMYFSSEGEIYFDEFNVQDCELRSLRQKLGVVTQSPRIFGASVKDNITRHDNAVGLSRVMEVARIAQIHEDIVAMPMGYNMLIAENGGTLSGGQQQRIALARALIHRPKILLLDEATSALDTLTEERIHRELNAMHITRIVIAHRMSTIMNADRIYVLDGGCIVESGNHQELIDQQGLYFKLLNHDDEN